MLAPMRPLSLGGVVAGSLACLAMAGCGGSSPTHSRTATSTQASAPGTSATGTTTTEATTAATTTARPPEVPASRATGTGTGTATGTSKPPRVNPGGPVTGSRFPAAFTIGAGGELNPPSVAGPTGATVDLRLANHDRRAHTVVVTTPVRRTFRLAAGATASAVLSGLRKASYRVLVDGTARGQVIIGAEGGP